MMTDEVTDNEPGMPGCGSVVGAADAGQTRVDGALKHRDRAAASDAHDGALRRI